MMKIKNMVKKGGVADIVTLMVIVGLVIALIIAVVLPMVNQATESGGDNSGMISHTDSFIGSLAGKGTSPYGQNGGGDQTPGGGDQTPLE